MKQFFQYLQEATRSPFQPFKHNIDTRWDDRFDRNEYEVHPKQPDEEDLRRIEEKHQKLLQSAEERYTTLTPEQKLGVIDKYKRLLRKKWDDAYPENEWEIPGDYVDLSQVPPQYLATNKYGKTVLNNQYEQDKQDIRDEKHRKDIEDSVKIKAQKYFGERGNNIISDMPLNKTGKYRILLLKHEGKIKIVFQEYESPHAFAYTRYGLSNITNRDAGQGALHGFFLAGNVSFRRDNNLEIPTENEFLKGAIILKKAGLVDDNNTYEFPTQDYRTATYTIGQITGNQVGDYKPHDEEAERREKVAPYQAKLASIEKDRIRNLYKNKENDPAAWFNRYQGDSYQPKTFKHWLTLHENYSKI